MDRRVQKVIGLIKDNLDRELSIGEMAQSVNLSPSRLRYVFKAETGMTPAQYFRSHRIHLIRELVETSFLSVKEIMDKVGIRDRSHFFRVFKKAYGLTPTQHRARLGGESGAFQSPTDLTGLAVLLVEDDLVKREVFTLALEKFGAHVLGAISTSEAIAALEQLRPRVMAASIEGQGVDGSPADRRDTARGAATRRTDHGHVADDPRRS
jgi:AraC-like DNA-binding protein